MSKKVYIALAQALAAERPIGDYTQYEWMDQTIGQWLADCKAIADTLAEHNTRFDHTRFLSACGYPIHTLV
jgi:hypothetical protein